LGGAHVLDQTGDRSFGSADISTPSGRVLSLIVEKVKRRIVNFLPPVAIASTNDWCFYVSLATKILVLRGASGTPASAARPDVDVELRSRSFKRCPA
jgi:hypothetical protein